MPNLTHLIEKLPEKVQEPAAQLAEKAVLVVSGDGPRSVAARAAFFAFSIRVCAAILAFGTQIVLARMLGAYQYGIYSIVWVWVLVLSTFATFGYPTGLLRFIPELYTAGRLGELRTVLVRGPLLCFALSSIISALGIAMLIFAPNLFDNQFIMPMLVAAIIIPLLTVVESQEGIAQAFDWMALRLVPTFIARPTAILIIFVTMTMAGVEATATSAMIAALAGVWVMGFVQFLVLRRRLALKVGKGPYEGSVRPWVRAALPMLLVEGFFFLIINTDVMVAGLFVAPDQVAVYYAAAKIMALMHFVGFAIRVATYHKIAEYHASGNRAALENTLSDALHWTFWPSVVIALALMWQGPLFLSLFGDGFEGGMTFLTILAIGIIVRSSVGPGEAMLTMANRQNTAAKVYGFVFVVNLGLNLILIPTIGLIGAAIATATAMAVEAILLVYTVRRHLGVITFVGLARRFQSEPYGPAHTEPAK